MSREDFSLLVNVAVLIVMICELYIHHHEHLIEIEKYKQGR